MKLDIPTRDFAGYLFDLDGTLIDSMPVHFRAWEAALRRFGLTQPLDVDLFYSLAGMPTLQVAEILGRHHGLALDPAQVMALKETLYLDQLETIERIEPVAAIAREKARLRPMAIVTGGTPDVAIPALKAAGLFELFPHVITPHDVPPGRGKPAPDMFLLAAKRMGVPPQDCVVFEDGEPGVVGARAAGMAVVHVPSRR